MSEIAFAALANLIHPTDPHPPTGWVAVDTHFGPISHSAKNPWPSIELPRKFSRSVVVTSLFFLISAMLGPRFFARLLFFFILGMGLFLYCFLRA